MTGLSIAGRGVGPGNKALIIAEIAQAHDGSLGVAHAYIDAVAEAGVDAVKFQTHIAAAESTLDEPFRVNFTQQGLNALRLLEADGIHARAMAGPCSSPARTRTSSS